MDQQPGDMTAALDSLIAALDTETLKAMMVIGGTHLATRHMDAVPLVKTHADSGAGVEVAVTLTPQPAVNVLLVDSNGTRRLILGGSLKWSRRR